MQFSELIKEKGLIDIISIGETNYALSSDGGPVNGCVAVPVSQLHSRLKDFLAHGYSQRYRKPYRQIAGLSSWTLFSYSLSSLPATKKQVFSHTLMGTVVREGFLSRIGGQKLGRSSFFVPSEREEEAMDFLNQWKADYTREVVLRG